MKKTFFILAALLLFCIPTIFAQQKVKSIEVTPFFAWENFDSNLFMKDNLLYGVKIGLNFSKRMEGEFVYSMGKSDTDPFIFFYADPINLNAREDYELSFWSFNFIYNFKPFKEKFVPFAEAGMGRYRIKRTSDIYLYDGIEDENIYLTQAEDSQSSPSIMLGGGLRYFINKKYALRFDITGIKYKHDVKDLDAELGSDYLSVFYTTSNDSLLNIETSIGFSFFFGGKE